MANDCARCGRTPAAADAFCTACGQPLSSACEACGAALPSDASYCGRCGAPRRGWGAGPIHPAAKRPPRMPPPHWRVAAAGLGVAAASLLALWLLPVARLLDRSFSISQAGFFCTARTLRPSLAAAVHAACQASQTGHVFVDGGLGAGALLLLAGLLARRVARPA